MTTRIASGLAVLALAFLGAGRAAGQDEGWVKLFNGKDLSGWTTFLANKSVPAEEVWTVKDGVIHCKGRPNGYLCTEKEYGDYVLKFEWRWPERAGNSGAFVHVSGPDKIWPKGAEAQLQSGAAGDFWLVDGFKLKVDKERQDPRQARHYFRTKKEGVEKPVGDWNTYEITCDGDKIKLAINGQVVNEGTEAEATRGKIILQSEGAPIEFRNIMLKSLK
jgi:hypothetical protein